MRNILITGGCGFIGSHGVRTFLRAFPRANVVNLDLLTYAGNEENLKDLTGEKRYRLIRGSIGDAPLVDGLLRENGFDLIVNFAAETHVDRSIIDVSDFIETNVGSVRVLIEAVRRHKVPRFVHISTDEVYGSVASGCASEEAPLRPSNPYSASKAAGDLLVRSFVTTHQLPAIIVRGSNNYGPYQYPEKLIPLSITNLIEGRKVPLHGDGMHIRNWLHVEDFCDAIALVAEKGVLGNVYNVAAEECTNLQLLERIANALTLSLEGTLEPVKDRPGADARYAPDSTKIREAFGWNPTRSLEKNLPAVVQWYLENSEWWKAIKEKKAYQDHYAKQSKGQWY